MNRRAFLGGLASLAAARAQAPAKPLRGVFPIGQTPFTEADKLDLDCLTAEVRFCNRTRVHGFAWPQIASNWTTLTERERLDGAEAILAAGKGGTTAIVIGVQDKAGDPAKVAAYARHAERNGADAIISLPPEQGDAIAYYKALGAVTPLPLIVQTQGSMSVDLVVEMFRQIPTMKAVKDEAGNPLARITEIRERTQDRLAVFSGKGVRTMIDEMRLGFAGHCPYPGLADFYAAAFDLWHAGDQRGGFDMFGRIQAFLSITGAADYVMVARGIFKDTTRSRGPATPPLDAATRRSVRDGFERFLKPHLRA